jgi:hypothetical protein
MAETVPPPMSGIRSRPEIGEEEMVCTVQEHAVGRVKSREPFLIQDQTHGALRRDPVAPCCAINEPNCDRLEECLTKTYNRREL